MSSVLALDIGEKRVGVAIAEAPVYIAHPLTTLDAKDLSSQLQKLVAERDVTTLVVGLPRNQAGESTAQTEYAQQIVENLNVGKEIKIEWQDESLTSVKAEEELESRGKPFEKSDIDALAATFILEDYLKERSGS